VPRFPHSDSEEFVEAVENLISLPLSGSSLAEDKIPHPPLDSQEVFKGENDLK